MLSQIISKKPFENKTLGKKQLLIFGIFLIILFSLGILFVKYQNNKVNRKTPVSIPKDAVFVPDEIVVKYKEGFSPNDFQKKLNEIGVISFEKVYKETEDPVLKRYYLLKLRKGTDIRKVHEILSDSKEIEFSQPNYILRIQDVPNDPNYSQQWDMKKIGMEETWSITKGSDQVIAAVLDTGIDFNHQDLPNQNIVHGRNFAYGNDNSMDDHGHGTHVSGTIGASSNNNLGVTGINWNVKIMAVKVCTSSGSCDNSATTQGIQYAADNGAKVINMSLGGAPSCAQTPMVQDAINYAINKGVTVVVAAGNDRQDASYYNPASCNGVITVGASTPGDSRASFSNFGSIVAIAAPGTSILSTRLGGGSTTMQGTSMASPHVAGAVAILLAACPNLSPQQVRDYLVSNADPISTDMPIGPRLNVYKAINACTGGAPIPTSNPNTSITPTGSTITPTTAPLSYMIFGNVHMTTGQGIRGANMILTGFDSKTTSTDSSGNYSFDLGNSVPDNNYYYITLEYNGRQTLSDQISLTSNSPRYIINFEVSIDPSVTPIMRKTTPTAFPPPTSGLSPTSRPGQSPTSGVSPTSPASVSPTSPPSNNQPFPSKKPTPTPLPYTCVPDQKCLDESGQNNIQLCPLKCTPL
ncbi:MAG: S8 family peptidase [Candidatus Levybacteria bacterium]|nr:S8 family peptidase [Candidatus Levybacteria bacterium]